MTRCGDDYVRGLRDGRTVLLNGERVVDVTTHPAFAAAIRTIAGLYDLAHDRANRALMTYPSPRDGRPINKAWLVPHTQQDLAERRRAIKFWADASCGFLGRSPDHVASFFAGFAGSPAFYARGGKIFAENLLRFAAKAADEDLYVSYVIVHPTIDRAKPAHQQTEPYLYAGVAAERDSGIVIRGAQMLGTLCARMSLLPGCDPAAARAAELGLRGVIGGAAPLLEAGVGLLVLDPPSLVLSALKPPEHGEGIVVRVLNPTDSAATATLRVNLPFKTATSVRLDEESERHRVDVDGSVVRFDVPPHALRSIRLQ